jgi:hypothetical protein
MFKNKPNILNKFKGRKSSADTSGKPVTLAVQNDTYQTGSMHSSESFEGLIKFILKATCKRDFLHVFISSTKNDELYLQSI